ncbi:MAG: VOC family protein [Hyphomicrobiaceae bacterium]
MPGTTQIGPCSPFLIVSDLTTSLAHYVDKLGFDCRFTSPNEDPFFAIVGRGSAQIMIKVIDETIQPVPNHTRHEWAGLDVFIFTPDPDTLAKEFAGRNVTFHKPLADNSEDGLRGFEIADPDGYVCYFGRPTEERMP